MGAEADHRTLADAVRQSVAAGQDARATTVAMAIGAGGDASVAAAYADLARTIDRASYRVTGEQVAAAAAEAGSDRGAFEVVMAAGVGAALRRWDAAIRAIEEAADASR